MNILKGNINMSQEFDDLDDLLNNHVDYDEEDDGLYEEEDDFEEYDEDDELDELDGPAPGKKPKPKAEKKPAVKQKSGKSIVPLIATGVITAALFGIGGFVAGNMTATPAPAQQAQPAAPKKVATINKTETLSKRVETVKDSQLNALNAQLAAISGLADAPESGFEKSFNGLVTKTANDLLNGFFQYALEDGPGKSNAERYKAIEQFLHLGDQDEDRVRANIEQFLEASSLAKLKNVETAKAGTAIPSLLVANDTSRVYQVMIPVAARDDKIYNALYYVRTTKQDKITAVTFAGYLEGNAAPEIYFTDLENVIKNEVAMSESNSTTRDIGTLTQNPLDNGEEISGSTNTKVDVKPVETDEAETTQAATSEAPASQLPATPVE